MSEGQENPDSDGSLQSQAAAGGGLWLYNLSILFGVMIVIYVFGVAFDDFSENELVQLTLAWYTPIIFGIYGRTATKIMVHMDEGTLHERLQRINFIFRISMILNLICFFPFFFLKAGSPLKVALSGAMIWLGLLALFFFGIWPNL